MILDILYIVFTLSIMPTLYYTLDNYLLFIERVLSYYRCFAFSCRISTDTKYVKSARQGNSATTNDETFSNVIYSIV